MTEYICKCGRVVSKSTNADNTGNRDTAGCEGCPYLLPWGPLVYGADRDGVKGYHMDMKGYECRMSPILEYTSTYHGRTDDKGSLHIVSLDLDFLDEVQAWIYDHAADTLTAGFSRGNIRGIEFSDKGRYSLSVLCARNKKGIAAKAALLAHFFGPDKHRLDMSAAEEKVRILAAIEDGKARAQRKETDQMSPIISENLKTDGVYAYYDGRFWVYGKTANEWFVSELTADEYRKALAGDTELTPEDFMVASDVFAQLEDWEITTTMINSLMRAAESVHPQHADEPDANPTQAAPASPADAGAAEQSPSDAEAVSLAAESAPEAFDYTGLDEPTRDALHWAEREIGEARRDYIARLAQAVYVAHDALCGSCDNLSQLKHGNRGDATFGAWCSSVGLSRKTAERLLQVNALLSGATPDEQAALEAASPSLLYAAAKPSAPTELVQAVKDGDITTYKQYQEALAQLKAAQEARQQAEAERDEARREAETAARKARETEKERDGARDALRAAKARGDKWQEKAEGMSAQLEQMRAAPIDAAGADADRVEELVQARLKALSARREPDEDEDARAHHAYDAFILASRSMDSVWKTLKPLAADLAPGQAGAAGNLLVQKLTEIREDVIHVCENRES